MCYMQVLPPPTSLSGCPSSLYRCPPDSQSACKPLQLPLRLPLRLSLCGHLLNHAHAVELCLTG